VSRKMSLLSKKTIETGSLSAENTKNGQQKTGKRFYFQMRPCSVYLEHLENRLSEDEKVNAVNKELYQNVPA